MRSLQFKCSPESYGSLSTYLPLKVLDSLISDRRLPLNGLGLMTVIELRFSIAVLLRKHAHSKSPQELAKLAADLFRTPGPKNTFPRSLGF